MATKLREEHREVWQLGTNEGALTLVVELDGSGYELRRNGSAVALEMDTDEARQLVRVLGKALTPNTRQAEADGLTQPGTEGFGEDHNGQNAQARGQAPPSSR
jgi:hypothetical protein